MFLVAKAKILFLYHTHTYTHPTHFVNRYCALVVAAATAAVATAAAVVAFFLLSTLTHSSFTLPQPHQKLAVYVLCTMNRNERTDAMVCMCPMFVHTVHPLSLFVFGMCSSVHSTHCYMSY